VTRRLSLRGSGKKSLEGLPSQLHKEGGLAIQAAVDNPDKLDWQEQAACRNYDNVLFFGPDQGESELEKQAREARAKAVCQRCPVSDPCLEFAMETNQKYGIWGGLTDKERASLKRRRARARRAS
jgi:WhiB family redox-sensing transcriptional regulator